MEQTHLVEVGVFGDYYEVVLCSVAPDCEIVRLDEVEVPRVDGVRIDVGQQPDEFER